VAVGAELLEDPVAEDDPAVVERDCDLHAL
jgi:hypothetical protein